MKIPCSPGCSGHVSHPCEKCGQQWDKPEAKMNDTVIINVRFGDGTYTARAKGLNKAVSRTSCGKDAAEALAVKLMTGKPYTLKQYGTLYTWVLSKIPEGKE